MRTQASNLRRPIIKKLILKQNFCNLKIYARSERGFLSDDKYIPSERILCRSVKGIFMIHQGLDSVRHLSCRDTSIVQWKILVAILRVRNKIMQTRSAEEINGPTDQDNTTTHAPQVAEGDEAYSSLTPNSQSPINEGHERVLRSNENPNDNKNADIALVEEPSC